ncbi:MAG: hypothetical protein ACYC3B_07545 [Sedimentisphaerales bacterium]
MENVNKGFTLILSIFAINEYLLGCFGLSRLSTLVAIMACVTLALICLKDFIEKSKQKIKKLKMFRLLDWFDRVYPQFSIICFFIFLTMFFIIGPRSSIKVFPISGLDNFVEEKVLDAQIHNWPSRRGDGPSVFPDFPLPIKCVPLIIDFTNIGRSDRSIVNIRLKAQFFFGESP